MIKKVEFSFGTVYLADNKPKAVKYNFLVDTESHPSFDFIKDEYFNKERNDELFEQGIYGTGKYDIHPFWLSPDNISREDVPFVKREFPEYLL